MQTLSEYLEKINCLGCFRNYTAVYRGHSDFTYKLRASVFREELNLADIEDELLSELMTFHPEEFAQRTTTFDRLVHAQHHGLPTRLLDVSFNPLVALFFCVETLSSNSGSVVVINVKKARVKNSDSDALSLVSNLSRLRGDERLEIRNVLRSANKYSKITEVDEKEFNELESVKRLIQFIKMEKPYFENKARPIDLWSNFLAIPQQNNARLAAQHGAFLVSGVLRNLANSCETPYKEIEIPASAKPGLKRELDLVGINRRTLYPGLESTADYLKKRFCVSQKN